MKQEKYIVASSKEWHKAAFETLKQEEPGDWYWVSTSDQLADLVDQAAPHYIFFLHWNWLVPRDIWERFECVCFHMTDVPYGRGGSPLQNLIKAGHRETKLSALRMVDEMDAGPVYTKRPLSLAGRAEDIYQRAGKLSVDIIRWMIATQPAPVAQQGDVVTFKRRTPAQSELPREAGLDELYDHIRMLDAPTYPHAFIERDGYRYEFTQAERGDGELRAQVVIRPIRSEETAGS
ncbi:methionyl-tRNA formyltransferase [Pistricoccus aurantiacus]|uniref:Methionyl-tRNA formyltransferase n=2 Tax=Pistricoccus aurantiacus TaxID=1883414 RepID=A0A5B8SSH0_9GAMM|nr:methionyl-tRNA formyltransferase [Pistricoccus aurantiacus]